MAKKRKKLASELTTDEALQRLFGKKAAKRLRELLEFEDERKRSKKRKKDDED
jgi:hypothetical protein